MKKNTLRIISFILCLLLLLPIVSACSPDSYTLEFYVTGKLYETLTTSGKEIISLPTAPAKDGYAFRGWYTDENYTTEFTETYFTAGNPRTNMKLYAAYSIDKDAKIDFFGDLSKYVTLSPEDYRGFTVVNTVEKITDRDVDMEVLKLLRKNSGEVLGEADGGTVIGAGDVVTLKYRGYTYDDNGHKSYFDGGCNFTSQTYDLEIGSGNFVIGFELGLFGKDYSVYSTLEELTGGTVAAGDTVYVTLTAKKGSAEAKTQTLLIDLNSTNLDSTWGTGFKDYLVGKTIGEKLTGLNESFTSADGEITYSSINVAKAYRASGNEILVVEAYFPNDYKEESLRGKTAYFECYISKMSDYDSATYSDSFVTDVIKADPSLYEKYSGEGAAEKYREYLRYLLELERIEKVEALMEDALLDCLGNAAVVHEYPSADLYEMYESIISQIYSNYQNYSSYYTFPEFVILYYGLTEDADPEAFLLDQAKLVIKEKLAFHYAATLEGIKLEGNALTDKTNEYVDKAVNQLLESYGIKRENFNSDKEYREKVQSYKKDLVQYYGMEYFEYEAFYGYAKDELCKLLVLSED